METDPVLHLNTKIILYDYQEAYYIGVDLYRHRAHLIRIFFQDIHF